MGSGYVCLLEEVIKSPKDLSKHVLKCLFCCCWLSQVF